MVSDCTLQPPFKKLQLVVLVGVAQLERPPTMERFLGLILGQGSGLEPWAGACGRPLISVPLSHQCFSLSLPLS